MNDYELVTILNGEIKDEDVEDTVGRINQFITNRGGEVQNIDQWGRRRLAYPIGRQFEGTYVVTHLRLQPANAAELEANLRISEDVLRHLLVRYSPAEQAAAIAAAQRRRPRPLPEEAGEQQPPVEGTTASTGEAATEGSAPDGAVATAAEPEPAEAAASATEDSVAEAGADAVAETTAEQEANEVAEAVTEAAAEPETSVALESEGAETATKARQTREES